MNMLSRKNEFEADAYAGLLRRLREVRTILLTRQLLETAGRFFDLLGKFTL